MPIYEYRCPNGHEFEVFQRMSEAPMARCRDCGAPVERVFHPVAVHFKGKGFYTTDYARGAAGADGGPPSSEKKKDPEKKESGKEPSKQGAEGKASGGEKSKAGSGTD
jgi:putative FmdB family regulatory protein